jgi:kynurenine formamidase
MIATIEIAGTPYKVNLNQGLDISIPVQADPHAARAWYLDPPIIEPVRTELFTGSVAEGGSVNFRNIQFNPHGHGTHTECVGHISEEVHSINQNLKQFFSIAALVSAEPRVVEESGDLMQAGDRVIDADVLAVLPQNYPLDALIIRSLPNFKDKLQRNYSDTNPPYLSESCMQAIVDLGIRHLLIDLPSVDRESDGGELRCHHLFWQHPEQTRLDKTITELIYVPSAIRDGIYLLELQVAPFENDASPSRPLLYRLID